MALGLPVYHVLEDEVRAGVDPDTYERHVGAMVDVLDVDSIATVVTQIREGG